MPGILNPYIAGGGGGGIFVYISPTERPLEEYNANSSGFSSVVLYAIVSGGVPPYTFAWSRVGPADGISPSGPTNLDNVTLTATGSGSGINIDQETWEVLVTDSAMNSDSDSLLLRFYFGLAPP